MELSHSVQSAIRTTTANSATNVVGVTSKGADMVIAGILNATFVYPTILHVLGWRPRHIKSAPLVGAENDFAVLNAILPLE
jgi:hypothetical protein